VEIKRYKESEQVIGVLGMLFVIIGFILELSLN